MWLFSNTIWASKGAEQTLRRPAPVAAGGELALSKVPHFLLGYVTSLGRETQR